MIKAVLLDLDGTVYNGNKLIDGSDEAIAGMRDAGIHVLFCTNNSSKLPSSISKKLNDMGVDCVEEDVISSGMMAIQYVLDAGLDDLYVLGSEELKGGFIDHGITITDEKDVRSMVIGMDLEFDYVKMTSGLRAAFKADRIILCNEDRWFEKDDGMYPGCGGMTSSILHCSGKQPDLVIGKPNVLMMEYVSRRYGYTPGEMLVIGDSMESDVAMACRYGSPYLLIDENRKGDCVIPSLADVIDREWSL